MVGNEQTKFALLQSRLHSCNFNNECSRGSEIKIGWEDIEISRKVKWATTSMNLLKKYYCYYAVID
jgi:hypothetical protein